MNPLYMERLDYRYYRLKKTKARRTGFETGKIKDQIRRMAYSLEEHLFTGEKPILILDFLAFVTRPTRWKCQRRKLMLRYFTF